jgi:hypothetical protein
MGDEHYCIQAARIEKMDRKLDDIHDQFQVDGTVGVMARQVEKLTTMVEERHPPKNNGGINGSVPTKLVLWIVGSLVAVVLFLLGIDLPL